MTSRLWKSLGSGRPTKTGYNGTFGDSFFSDCWDTVDRPSNKIIHEDVTTDVPEDKVKPMFRKSHLSRMHSDDMYQVMLEVSHFAPSDLSVKLVNDKTVVVEGKHPERKDPQGFVSREFTRKYNLPDSVNPSTVQCFLSLDGVLVIRGHADRPSSSIMGAYDDLHTGHVIPIYTHGYHKKTQSLDESQQHHVERIIPITREDRTSQLESGGDHSGRNSRSSNVNADQHDQSEKVRVTSPDIPNHHQSKESNIHHQQKASENGHGHRKSPDRKERKVSFSDESHEESLSSESTATTTKKSHEYNYSREEKGRSPIPIITSPTPTTPRNEDISVSIDSRRSPFFMDYESQKSSTSEKNSTREVPVASTSHSTFEESRRRRNESMESQQSDRFFSSRNSDLGKEIERMSPFGSRLRDRDIFADFDFHAPSLGLGLGSPKWDDDFRMMDIDHLPVNSREQKYEKMSGKELKDGKWVESFEERFHSEQYSKSSSGFNKSNNGNLMDDSMRTSQQRLRDRPKEHRINISSPA